MFVKENPDRKKEREKKKECSKKTSKLSKNDKFVTCKAKNCFFISFIIFMKLVPNVRLIVFISQVILSGNLPNKKKKKMMQHRNR